MVNVIGQEAVKQQLVSEVLEGRMPHALMITGAAGSGKLPLALALAKLMTCDNRAEYGEACGRCASCVKWHKLVHPDVHFVFPIVKNSKLKKEVCNDYLMEWRAMLTESAYVDLPEWLRRMDSENAQAMIFVKESDEISRKLTLKASEGGVKVTIVWLPERMHEAAANKLLKLLEEPPEKTYFILVTENAEKVLPTIVSRTRRVNLPPISEDVMMLVLQKEFALMPEDAKRTAHLAGGNMLKAIEAISLNDEKKLFLELFINLMRLSWQRKIREMKQWSEQVAAMGRERQKNFLEYVQQMVRENFIYNFRKADMTYMTTAEEEFAKRFSPYINERNVMLMMDELTMAQRHIEQNVNAKMVFFDFALKMIVLLKNNN